LETGGTYQQPLLCRSEAPTCRTEQGQRGSQEEGCQTSTPSSAGKAVEQAASNVEPISKQYNAMLLLIPCHSHIEDRY
jgi:hypothetical protein